MKKKSKKYIHQLHALPCACLSSLQAYLGAFLFALFLLCTPTCLAYADANYSIEEQSTNLQVYSDGSIRVISQQILSFQGENTGYTWYLYSPQSGESVKLSSIRIAPVDDGGTPLEDWTRLQMVDVDAQNQGQWPGDSADFVLRRSDIQPWYSYELSTGMVRSYFPANNASYVIEATYTISNYVSIYHDIADFSWRYAHASTPVASQDVSLQITLPVPYDYEVIPEDSIMAWGHGPSDGEFNVNDDGSIIYLVNYLEQDHYAEAHVIFPASWMSNVSLSNPKLYTEIHKQDAVEEEATWVDQSMREESWDNKVRVLCFSLAVLVLVVGVICVLRMGFTARLRRALIRVAVTLGIEALAVELLFAEPFTVRCLLAVALVILILSLFLPQKDILEHWSIESDLSSDAASYSLVADALATDALATDALVEGSLAENTPIENAPTKGSPAELADNAPASNAGADKQASNSDSAHYSHT